MVTWQHGSENVLHATEKKVTRDVPTFKELFGDNNIACRTATLWEFHLVFGQYPINEVLKEVANPQWQRERHRMLGSNHEFKWNVLRAYLYTCGFSRHSRVVVTNYVYAIKRGGLIK